MIPICWCLLALISSGLAFPRSQPRDSNPFTSLSTRGHSYGASIGYKQAEIKDYPYLASLIYETWKVPVGAAAILNKHWLVTMVYVSLVMPYEIKLYVGTNNAGRGGQPLNVTKNIGHKKFHRHYYLDYNIGLLKTDTPITFSDTVKPVKLANAVPKAGTNCTLLGYGFVEEKPFVGWDLGAATVQIKSKNQCESEHGHLKSAYCAASDNVVPCEGDLGDLLMYNNKLVGFFVGGDYCNQYKRSEVYTNVSAFRKWIWKTIKANSNENEMEGLYEDQFSED